MPRPRKHPEGSRASQGGQRGAHSPAQPEDVALLARIPARGQRAAARATGIPQQRMSAAAVEGIGRRLSARQRAALAAYLDVQKKDLESVDS